ncbi:MAG: glycosyltransferase family 9 protein [Planctomycetes bacterium]|nr:glycosyltransferase family 9 protein [Planctomycetota bacterium]
MDVLVDYQGGWGLGDLLCSDPMMLGLVERFGPDTGIWLNGKTGNVAHNPLVRGMAQPGQRFDHVVEVQLFTHMAREDYARLEAMPSLIDHMCSYAGVTPSDRRPRLHLQPDDLAVLRRVPLLPKPRVAICADFVDPLRHWPIERYREVARVLHECGAQVIGIGQQNRLGVGTDLCGKLTMRETAAVLTACNLFVGNNSGPFHYAQAAGLPCVTLFSLATPQRFFHPGARVYPVRAEGLPCLECMTRCFAAMQRSGCIASPRGRCMLDIPVEHVLDAIDRALGECRLAAPAPAPAVV